MARNNLPEISDESLQQLFGPNVDVRAASNPRVQHEEQSITNSALWHLEHLERPDNDEPPAVIRQLRPAKRLALGCGCCLFPAAVWITSPLIIKSMIWLDDPRYENEAWIAIFAFLGLVVIANTIIQKHVVK